MGSVIDAQAYGKALFLLAAQEQADTRVREELELVCQAFARYPSYVTLLDTPALATAEKLRLVRAAFGQAEPMLLNFLCILCERRACYRLSACAAAYGACYDEAHEIVRATAITALPMTPQQCQALQSRLAAITGKTVVLQNPTQPALIGGITLRYGGVQLDGSIRSRLERLRRSLRETIV